VTEIGRNLRPIETRDVDVVLSIDYYVDEAFGQGFFDSCVGVTFGMSNQPAVNIVGGGADNYQDFMTSLGSVQFQGSTFEIAFPIYGTWNEEMIGMNEASYGCTDATYACTCVDCTDICGVLPDLEDEANAMCYIGSLNCLAFSLIIIWGVGVLAALALVLIRKRKNSGVGEIIMKFQV